MTPRPVVTRRMLIRDMGKAGLAVVILGAAACSSEQTRLSTTATVGATSTTGPPGTSPASTAAPDTTTTTAAADAEAGWWRVQLGSVSAYVLARNGEAVVIDTGTGGSTPDIEAGLMEIGVGWSAVGQVIVTHQHGDHQGSLGAVLEAAGSPPWYAGAGDIGAIRAPYEGTAVGDGDSVFDTEIIETPGHTPGHIAVLDRGLEILFAGDALNGANGAVIGANPSFTRDMNRANASIQKLAGLEFDTVVFGHGDPVPIGASDAVKDLAASL